MLDPDLTLPIPWALLSSLAPLVLCLSSSLECELQRGQIVGLFSLLATDSGTELAHDTEAPGILWVAPAARVDLQAPGILSVPQDGTVSFVCSVCFYLSCISGQALEPTRIEALSKWNKRET